MRDQFNQTTTATSARSVDPINLMIFDEGREELRSNNVPLIKVQTIDDAERELNKHKDKKIFLICSGSLDQVLVPKLARHYPHVHQVYVYAFNLLLHLHWADDYTKMVKMFDFPTVLFVRLTRDISKYFIEQGKMLLTIDSPREALTCFKHAHRLELAANQRDKMQINPREEGTFFAQPDFRDHLDLLEGEQGLIAGGEAALRNEEYPQESS